MKVVEDVLLLLEHAGLVPFLAELAAAAKVGQGVDAAGLDPERRARRESRRLGECETAVAGQERRV